MRWARLKRPTRAKASATSSHSVPAERLVGRAVFDARELGSWYPPVLLGPGTLGTLATSSDTLRQAIDVLERLESDEYIRYLLAYYREGLQRFGDVWRYADIVTVLIAAAQLLRPASYLEIGVRRGRSMAVVAQACPECEAIGFDLWTGDYAGMANPGPAFVRAEMRKVGHTGRLELISGNSHVTLPAYFEAHPDAFFDLITVDGDHSEAGAERDLREVLPRLKIGGVIVFDDICHPQHPYLQRVWNRAVASDPRLAAWEFSELGYGVAFAIRRQA